MKFILHQRVKTDAQPALDWLRQFLSRFNLSQLGWLRIDFGREYRDRLGRRYRKYRGVYGRCWYPSASQPTVRISCQVPGPFPCDIPIRKTPVYRHPDGTWPAEARHLPGPIVVDRRSGRQWRRNYGKTRVHDLNEAIVWIFAHEAFHWLRKTCQIAGRNNEIEADAFGDLQLAAFRRWRTERSAPARPRQGELFSPEWFGSLPPPRPRRKGPLAILLPQ